MFSSYWQYIEVYALLYERENVFSQRAANTY